MVRRGKPEPESGIDRVLTLAIMLGAAVLNGLLVVGCLFGAGPFGG